jgi:Flp pilus assembly protein TadG
MKMNRKVARRRKGAVIAETAAAMALFLPLTIMITFVGVEVSYAYLLKSSLSEAAREASRSLAIAYGLDSSIVGNRTIADQKAFDHIACTT